MRLVLDTNVVVAGLLWNGPPRKLINAAIDATAGLVTSQALVDELTRILAYPKFTPRLAAQGASARALVERYMALATIVPAPSVAGVVPADPDDEHGIACAIAGQVNLIVSGDRDLLDLKSFRGIEIVKPREAAEKIAR